MLEQLGIDLGQSDRLRHILTVLSRFDEQYFLSRRWVGRKFEEVLSQLSKLEGAFQNLAESARKQTETLSATTDRLGNIDRAVDAIRDDAGSSLRQTRDLGEAIIKLTTQYSLLQTNSKSKLVPDM